MRIGCKACDGVHPVFDVGMVSARAIRKLPEMMGFAMRKKCSPACPFLDGTPVGFNSFLLSKAQHIHGIFEAIAFDVPFA